MMRLLSKVEVWLAALPPLMQFLLVLGAPALILGIVLALNRWDEWRDRRR